MCLSPLTGGEIREYCYSETFEPDCGDNKVRITSATVGRMSLGKCVQTDYGYVGCSQDATSFLQERYV